jgi:hypothetical protein
MDNIQGAYGAKHREGIVEHLVGDALRDISDVDGQSVLLLYKDKRSAKKRRVVMFGQRRVSFFFFFAVL